MYIEIDRQYHSKIYHNSILDSFQKLNKIMRLSDRQDSCKRLSFMISHIVSSDAEFIASDGQQHVYLLIGLPCQTSSCFVHIHSHGHRYKRIKEIDYVLKGWLLNECLGTILYLSKSKMAPMGFRLQYESLSIDLMRRLVKLGVVSNLQSHFHSIKLQN